MPEEPSLPSGTEKVLMLIKLTFPVARLRIATQDVETVQDAISPTASVATKEMRSCFAYVQKMHCSAFSHC